MLVLLIIQSFTVVTDQFKKKPKKLDEEPQIEQQEWRDLLNQFVSI